MLTTGSKVFLDHFLAFWKVSDTRQTMFVLNQRPGVDMAANPPDPEFIMDLHKLVKRALAYMWLSYSKSNICQMYVLIERWET
jgi:hypothetical protein